MHDDLASLILYHNEARQLVRLVLSVAFLQHIIEKQRQDSECCDLFRVFSNAARRRLASQSLHVSAIRVYVLYKEEMYDLSNRCDRKRRR